MGLLTQRSVALGCVGLALGVHGCGDGEPPCEVASADVCFCEGGFPGNHVCNTEAQWTECYCPFMGTTDTDSQSEPLAGESNFASYCSPCHGIRGTGTGDGPSLVQLVPTMTDAQIATTIQEGNGRMPAFRSFGDQQVADLVEYLRVSFGQ